MKEKLLDKLHNLIYEHEVSNFSTDYDKAKEILEMDAEQGFNAAYDVGRYETLKEMLRLIQKIGE